MPSKRFSFSKPIDIVISTVDRPENYIHKVLGSLQIAETLRLVVGSPSYAYLRRYKDNPLIEVIGVDLDDWKIYKDYSVKHRASWNYWRCLTLGGNPKRERKGMLLLEDDIEPADNWEYALQKTIEQIEAEYGEDYVLSLYAPHSEISKPVRSTVRFQVYPPHMFFGTQAMYYPECVRAAFAEYMATEGVTLFRTHYDVLLREYLLRTGLPLFATTPCLFQHIGAVGTGLAPTFHRAGFFRKKN